MIFGDLDAWIRNRLRSMQLKKWKNPHKFQWIMMKSGVKPQEAHGVWIRMNKWQSVHRRAVRFTLNLKWFRERGLFVLKDFTKRPLELPLFSYVWKTMETPCFSAGRRIRDPQPVPLPAISSHRVHRSKPIPTFCGYFSLDPQHDFSYTRRKKQCLISQALLYERPLFNCSSAAAKDLNPYFFIVFSSMISHIFCFSAAYLSISCR